MRYIPDSFVACVEETVVHKEMQQVASFSSGLRHKRPPAVSLPIFPSFSPPTEALPVGRQSRSVWERGSFFESIFFFQRIQFSYRLVSQDLIHQSMFSNFSQCRAVPSLKGLRSGQWFCLPNSQDFPGLSVCYYRLEAGQ